MQDKEILYQELKWSKEEYSEIYTKLEKELAKVREKETLLLNRLEFYTNRIKNTTGMINELKTELGIEEE